MSIGIVDIVIIGALILWIIILYKNAKNLIKQYKKDKEHREQERKKWESKENDWMIKG